MIAFILYGLVIIALTLNVDVRYPRKYPRRFSCRIVDGVPNDIKYID